MQYHRYMHRILHHTRRHLARKRNQFILGIVLLNIVFIIQILCNVYSFPNTYIGDISVGMMTRQKLQQSLLHLSQSKRDIDIHGKIYQYSYEDLGIYLDTDQTISAIRSANSLPFPRNQLTFLASFFIKRQIEPVLHFSQEYFEFTNSTIYDDSLGDDFVYLDQVNKKLGMIEQTQRFSLDPYALQVILNESFGQFQNSIKAPIIPVQTRIKQAVEEINTKLKRVYDTPLTLIVGGQDNHIFFPFSEATLQEVSIASVSADQASVTFVIDHILLSKYLQTLWIQIHKTSPDPAIFARIANGMQKALADRANGIPADSVGVPVDSGPNTDGTLADRYIEVDISQQKMYTFKKGMLIKTYRVSTGKDYPTPTGTFEILNKTGLGFSNIYNVWMPWWMGFSYSNKLHAYFGIHELPFYYAGGTKIQRPRDFIGTPNTGGCVALDVGEAKEVYQFADIGTKIVIYE